MCNSNYSTKVILCKAQAWSNDTKKNKPRSGCTWNKELYGICATNDEVRCWKIAKMGFQYIHACKMNAYWSWGAIKHTLLRVLPRKRFSVWHITKKKLVNLLSLIFNLKTDCVYILSWFGIDKIRLFYATYLPLTNNNLMYTTSLCNVTLMTAGLEILNLQILPKCSPLFTCLDILIKKYVCLIQNSMHHWYIINYVSVSIFFIRLKWFT